VTVGLEPFSDPITPSDQPAMLDRPALTVLTTSTIPSSRLQRCRSGRCDPLWTFTYLARDTNAAICTMDKVATADHRKTVTARRALIERSRNAE
jgi:hypothetical protein